MNEPLIKGGASITAKYGIPDLGIINTNTNPNSSELLKKYNDSRKTASITGDNNFQNYMDTLLDRTVIPRPEYYTNVIEELKKGWGKLICYMLKHSREIRCISYDSLNSFVFLVEMDYNADPVFSSDEISVKSDKPDKSKPQSKYRYHTNMVFKICIIHDSENTETNNVLSPDFTIPNTNKTTKKQSVSSNNFFNECKTQFDIYQDTFNWFDAKPLNFCILGYEKMSTFNDCILFLNFLNIFLKQEYQSVTKYLIEFLNKNITYKLGIIFMENANHYRLVSNVITDTKYDPKIKKIACACSITAAIFLMITCKIINIDFHTSNVFVNIPTIKSFSGILNGNENTINKIFAETFYNQFNQNINVSKLIDFSKIVHINDSDINITLDNFKKCFNNNEKHSIINNNDAIKCVKDFLKIIILKDFENNHNNIQCSDFIDQLFDTNIEHFLKTPPNSSIIGSNVDDYFNTINASNNNYFIFISYLLNTMIESYTTNIGNKSTTVKKYDIAGYKGYDNLKINIIEILKNNTGFDFIRLPFEFNNTIDNTKIYYGTLRSQQYIYIGVNSDRDHSLIKIKNINLIQNTTMTPTTINITIEYDIIPIENSEPMKNSIVIHNIFTIDEYKFTASKYDGNKFSKLEKIVIPPNLSTIDYKKQNGVSNNKMKKDALFEMQQKLYKYLLDNNQRFVSTNVLILSDICKPDPDPLYYFLNNFCNENNPIIPTVSLKDSTFVLTNYTSFNNSQNQPITVNTGTVRKVGFTE
jgi:hypothetical protein